MLHRYHLQVKEVSLVSHDVSRSRILRARLDLWRRSGNIMMIPVPVKRKDQRSSKLSQTMVLFGRRPSHLVQLANCLSGKLCSVHFARISLKGSMANMSYVDTSSAIMRVIAKSGYAKRTRRKTDLALLYHSPVAKHVAITRRMVPTTTQPPTFDVRTSSLVRISEVVAEKSANDAVA
jgi:hypothetical protein